MLITTTERSVMNVVTLFASSLVTQQSSPKQSNPALRCRQFRSVSTGVNNRYTRTFHTPLPNSRRCRIPSYRQFSRCRSFQLGIYFRKTVFTLQNTFEDRRFAAFVWKVQRNYEPNLICPDRRFLDLTKLCCNR